MSPHERERLAAWMDGELPPDERREVEAHLAECEECATLLSDLEAVDGVARDLPVGAPPGYFEDFPARVRTRIEAATAGGGRQGASGRWRTPGWTWAAAAALLLGVVTPLTLARLGRDGTPVSTVGVGADARESLARAEADDAARPVPSAAAPAPAPPRPASAELKAEIRQERDESEAPGAGAALQTTGDGFASAPAKRPAVRPLEKKDSPARDALASPAVLEESVATEEGAFEAVAVGEARSNVEAPGHQVAVAADAALSAPGADPELLVRGEAAKAQRIGAGKEVRGRRESAATGGQPQDAAAFGRLTRNDAKGAAAWRERREAWRAFVHDHPESPRLDEARVRVIESGIEAWRAAGDAGDLSRAREDAEAYLAREDARQKERVKRALEAIGER